MLGATARWSACSRCWIVSIHAPVLGATSPARFPHRQRWRFNPRPRAGGDVSTLASVRLIDSFNPRPRAGGDWCLPCFAAGVRQFQSTPPCWGRPGDWPGGILRGGFNPRPRAGGDTRATTLSTLAERFNPRPRAGGDSRLRASGRPMYGFNPRPRAGGDLRPSHRRPRARCFNPRPRAGGDQLQRAHAVELDAVSIHAPVLGATALQARSSRPTKSFNPRPRAGGDGRGDAAGRPDGVSIHAPVLGATRSATCGYPPPSSFNPRPRAGGDPTGMSLQRSWFSFNPRPRAGGDPTGMSLQRSWFSFNPRPRAGGDLRTRAFFSAGRTVSIHAPVLGATRRRCQRPS